MFSTRKQIPVFRLRDDSCTNAGRPGLGAGGQTKFKKYFGLFS